MNRLSMFNVKRTITNNNKYPYLIIFSIAVIFRIIPELLALPIPIGYDVINYYLPVLKDFDNYWPTISNQLPLYVSILHIITSILKVDPRIVLTSSTVLIYGLFSVVIFSISKNILRLTNLQSIFLSLFVIFQISVLRTSWDLHKDMLAITITFFCLSYISKIPNLSKKMIAVIVSLSVISIFTDRMIGFLYSLSLIVSAFMKRERVLVLIAIFIILVFSISLIANFDTIGSNIKLAGNKDIINQIYSPVNLIVLFLVMNGILLPTGLVGLIKSKTYTFKIPLFISLVGSFSWIVFPNTSAFLPDRWITIFSIFLSLFSAYGFVTLIENKRIAIFDKKINNYLLVLLPFILLGTIYALSPNSSLLIYNSLHEYIGQYVPMTMQYNSISLEESKSLLSLIDWTNNHTQQHSIIEGSKHLRGWMELGLENRTFQFSNNITKQLSLKNYDDLYLLNSKNLTIPQLKNYSSNLSYRNADFSLYHLKRNK